MFDNPLDLIQSIKNKRILLVGDTIIDKNTYGTLLGTSAETPTIVAERKSSNYSLGGAFLVARNLITLGAKVTFITLSGDDENTFLINYYGPNSSDRFGTFIQSSLYSILDDCDPDESNCVPILKNPFGVDLSPSFFDFLSPFFPIQHLNLNSSTIKVFLFFNCININ